MVGPSSGRNTSSTIQQTETKSEYDRAVEEGLKIITKTKPSILSQDSIEEIHHWYVYAAQQLLLEKKTPPHKIVNKLFNDFNQFYGHSWIYEILKHNKINVPRDDESSINGKNNSSLNSVYAQKHAQLIDAVNEDIEQKKRFVQYLQTEEYRDLIPEGEYNELVYIYRKSNEFMAQEWDGRQGVYTRTFLRMCTAAKAGNSDAATKLYFQYVKTRDTMVRKQWTKLVHGKAQLIHPFFDPKNEQEADDIGFYPVQCKHWVCNKCGFSQKDKPEVCGKITRRKDGYQVTESQCDGTVFKQCPSWRCMISKEGIPKFSVTCCACFAEFVPPTRKLPVKEGVALDEKIAESPQNHKAWKEKNGICGRCDKVMMEVRSPTGTVFVCSHCQNKP